MGESAATPPLLTWADQIHALDGVGADLLARWRPEGATEAEAQDMNKLALSILASGYLCHVYTDARRPVFMPLWNYGFNQGGPNPDYVYSTAEVDPAGVYEISGYRGTARFVEITQRKDKFLREAWVDEVDDSPLTATLDLDDLALAGDGRFSVRLSTERPEGFDGDWWHLDPRAHELLMRRCACDWNREVDARIAINRLDDPGEDMSPPEISRRFSELAEWVEETIRFDMRLVRWYREHHGINVLLHSGKTGLTKSGQVPGVLNQAYYDGIYEIDDSEALIVEIGLPEQCRYWQVLVADDRYATVDWVNRQSSLNDVQAQLDSDGRFRAVVSKADPGVPNWLDKADFPWGILQARFYHPSEFPEPTVIKVPVTDVRKHLPADTPVVSPEDRRQQLRLRREGAQMRTIW
jgi:hypothetical protein